MVCIVEVNVLMDSNLAIVVVLVSILGFDLAIVLAQGATDIIIGIGR